MVLNLSKIPKLLDSDYVPIPHTDPKWLPKSIRNEYKGITANARQATRLGCKLSEPSEFDTSTFKGRTRGNIAKYLIDAFATSVTSAKKKYKDKLLSAGQADLNKIYLKMRYRAYYRDLYIYKFQQLQIKYEYNGVFPRPIKTTSK
tara:strand:- start:177 stop:614 length:438 start_codon:yes stop_codon:yes gene_type:complete